MKWFRNLTDEREELELRRIESGAYYVFLLGLDIAIIVQFIIYGISFEHVIGEIIVLLAGVAWVMVGYIRRGIWDLKQNPVQKPMSDIVLSSRWFISFFQH